MELPSILDVARQAGLSPKAKGKGEYVITCPKSTGHTNGDAHPSCRLNPDKNVFCCDPCGWSGGVVEFARVVGVEIHNGRTPGKTPSTEKAPKEPMRFVATGPISEATIKEFSTRLGKDFPSETWAAFGVMEGTVQPGTNVAIGFPNHSGWYVVLYRKLDTRNKKPYSFRFTDGAKPTLITVGFERPGRVALCEGIWDAMRAYADGLPVSTGTGGAGTFKLEWAGRFYGRQVVAVYDVDPAGRLVQRNQLSC